MRAFLGGEGGGAGRRATLLLNLVDSRHAPLSAMCVVERRPGGCGALAGEVQRSDTEEILLSTTNEMAVAQRELAKSNRMLERKYVSASARAAMDELTGLFNRRHFDAELARQLARVRADRPLGLIMADIDHFKRVNDTLGHTAGDAVLQAMGACLLAGVRPSDVVARYGGEEFAVLLPDARLPEVVRVAERLRTTVGAMRMDGVDVTVTASFGVGCAFAPCDPVEFLNRVDAALYAAKADGRDRVRVAEEGAG